MVTKRASDKAINSDNFVDVDNDDVDNDKSVNEQREDDSDDRGPPNIGG